MKPINFYNSFISLVYAMLGLPLFSMETFANFLWAERTLIR
jgi:hypothetical protein